MKYCGIILVKENSKRLPNKNYLPINGIPCYYHAVNALKEYPTYVFEEGTNRPINASYPDEPIFDAIKWAYKSLDKTYDSVINIMANCPMITKEDVNRAIERYEQLGCKELRSFNKDGSESGLIIIDVVYLMKKHELSSYQGAIEIESTEIHTQKDYITCLNKMKKHD